MDGCESCTIKKAECCRIDAFKLWCWGRILRVPWKVRDSIPRQIDKKFRVPEEEKGVWGSQSGDRGLEFSRRRKGQTFFPLYVPSVSSITQSCPTLWPHELQHARPPRVFTNSCPLSWWCHPAISSSVILFSSCPQSLPSSGSFPMSQLFTWGGQSIGVSAWASVLPTNTQES